MQTIFPTFARFIHSIALALWLGGLIAIGALAAPTAFHAARTLPALAAHPDLQSNLAGAIIGNTLRKFNGLCYACGILMLFGDIALWVTSGGKRRHLTGISFVLSFILLASAGYLGFSMFPALDIAQQQNNKLAFDSLHHQYVTISYVQMALLLAAALVVGGRDSIRDRD